MNRSESRNEIQIRFAGAKHDRLKLSDSAGPQIGNITVPEFGRQEIVDVPGGVVSSHVDRPTRKFHAKSNDTPVRKRFNRLEVCRDVVSHNDNFHERLSLVEVWKRVGRHASTMCRLLYLVKLRPEVGNLHVVEGFADVGERGDAHAVRELALLGRRDERERKRKRKNDGEEQKNLGLHFFSPIGLPVFLQASGQLLILLYYIIV